MLNTCRADPTIGRVDPKVDRQVGDSLIHARQTVRFIFNLFANHIEVSEHPPLAVQELCIFCNI